MLHEQAKTYISGLSDSDLLEYVLTGLRIYEPEAVTFAKEELERRGLTHEEMATLRPAILRKLADVDAQTPPDMMRPGPSSAILCQGCGLEVPNQYVEYRQNVGLAVLRLWRCYKGYYCRTCNHRLFWKSTLITFFFGWWGAISFYITLVFLPRNVFNFLRTLTLPRVPANAMRPCCDDLVVEKVGPHVHRITERLMEGDDISDISREIAPLTGVTPGQVWCFVRAVVEKQGPDQEGPSGVTEGLSV